MKTADIKVEYVDHMGSDNQVVNAARVSFAKRADQYSDEANSRLIRYLAKHEHTSPFNHTFVTLQVKAPIFVSRQLVKHDKLIINEESRRYIDEEPEFYLPNVWHERAENKKQGTSELPVTEYRELVGWDNKDNDHVGFEWNWIPEPPNDYVAFHTQRCLDVYRDLLASGVAPEQARMVLPLNTMVNWVWSGTVFAFARMCNLRLPEDAQYETRLVAQEVDSIIAPLFPVSWKALLDK